MLTQEEKDDIDWFIQTVEEIKQSTFISRFQRSKYTMTIGNGKGSEKLDTFNQEGKESIYFVSSKLRQIYMTKERINFGKIANTIIRNTSNDKARKNVTKCKDLYNAKLKRYPSITIFFNGNRSNFKQILDHFFNATDFHSDRDKKESLDSILTPLLYRMQYIEAVQELLGVIITLANNARLFREEMGF